MNAQRRNLELLTQWVEVAAQVEADRGFLGVTPYVRAAETHGVLVTVVQQLTADAPPAGLGYDGHAAQAPGTAGQLTRRILVQERRHTYERPVDPGADVT